MSKTLSDVVIENDKILVDEDLLGKADVAQVYQAKYRLDDTKLGEFTVKEAIELAKKDEKFLVMMKAGTDPVKLSIIPKEDMDMFNRMMNCRLAARKSYEKYGEKRIETGMDLEIRWNQLLDADGPLYMSEFFKGSRDLSEEEVSELCRLMFETFWYFRSKESPTEFYRTDLTLALILKTIEIMWRRSYSDEKFTFSMHARSILGDLESGCQSYYASCYDENNVWICYDYDPGPCTIGGIDFKDYDAYECSFYSDCENAGDLFRQLMAACEESVYDCEGYEDYE